MPKRSVKHKPKHKIQKHRLTRPRTHHLARTSISHKDFVKSSFLSKKLFSIGKFNFPVEYLILILILIFAFYLRIMFLGAPAFWADESISAIASKNILEKGVPVFDSGVFYGRALVYHYSEALSLLAFGLNDFAARFPSVIFGMLTVLLAFFIGREYSKKAGLVAALFTATFFLEVFFSRQGRFYSLFQLAFFSSLFFLYKSKNNQKWIYPALFTFALAVDTNPYGIMLAPFFILEYFFFKKRVKKETRGRGKTNLKQKFLFLLIPIVILVAQGIDIISVFFGSLAAKVGRGEGMNFYASLAQEFKSQTFFTMPFVSILCAAGAFWAYFKNKRLTLIIIAPSIFVLAGLYFSSDFALRYFYFIIFPIVLFAGALFGFVAENKKQIIPVLIVLGVLLVVCSNIFFPNSFGFALLAPSENLIDASAPEISFAGIPASVHAELMDSGSVVVSLYSPPVEWYLKKPKYVLPFSLNGTYADEISIKKDGELVDIYSGSEVIRGLDELSGKFFFIEEYFASSKLELTKKIALDSVKKRCSFRFANKSIAIFECN
ncbi:Dolichyl-phosphate-mannose-protein mannosyltransferase [uncultured archaeon]|nr:Dolichyl-phosphate-mannose-protein mannosyltransferase [uncultured archaeon]